MPSDEQKALRTRATKNSTTGNLLRMASVIRAARSGLQAYSDTDHEDVGDDGCVQYHDHADGYDDDDDDEDD